MQKIKIMADSMEERQIADLKARLAAAEAEIAQLRRQQGAKQDTSVDHQQSQDKQAQPNTSKLRDGTKALFSKPESTKAEDKQKHSVKKHAPALALDKQDDKLRADCGENAALSLPEQRQTAASSTSRKPTDKLVSGAGLGGKDSNKRYKKTGGAADGAGNDYEHKMLSLVFLRMLGAGHEFQLASNMEPAGKFDDIVMRCRKLSDADWNSTFVQLKHKQNKNKFISKPELLGLSGDFSLIGYCHSHETMKLSEELHSFGNFNDHKIMIFTNASIADSLVHERKVDPLLNTGGKAVSFKAGGEVFKGLCEWVGIKKALTELQTQVEGFSGEEAEIKIKVAIEKLKFLSKTVTSFKGELLKTPTLVKLEALLTKLELVKDEATYSSFLAKLQIYTGQVHESELDAKIKEEIGKVWKCSIDLEAEAMLHALQDKVKSWWQKHNFYLTQDSQLWLGIIKSQAETLSRNTIEQLTKFEVEFEESSLQILSDRINNMSSFGRILNLRVDSRTTASSLRVYQVLGKFRPDEIVLHVNVKALLEREDDVLSAWATRWCHLLVVECDEELDQSQAGRISDKILKVIGIENENKVLFLIAPETHLLHQAVNCKTSDLHFDDSIKWGDLTQATRETILQTKVNVQGTAIALSDFEKKKRESERDLCNERGFKDCLVETFDLQIFSQLLKGDINCGKALDKVDRIFVPRRLKNSNYRNTFSVNSVCDVREKVVLLVAEPGMGKSTLISHLANSAKKEDPSGWIVHIKLNDCAAYLDSIDKGKLDSERTWKFLENCALTRGNKLEELIFRSLEHKLFVFVDGVDEVNPHYEGQIFALLSFLKDYKFSQLWVSSRPTFESKLENVLGVDALNIAEFSMTEQTEFFNKTWKKLDSSISDEKCTEITENLLKVFGKSLGAEDPVLGVPLMTSMIAEVYDSSIDKLVRNGRLDKISLVETYVERRFEILCNEKMKMQARHLSGNKDNEKDMKESIHSNHCLAALRVIFGSEEVKTLKFKGKEDFDKDLISYLEEISEGREKTGIIDNVINDAPHFTHRLFAEYFAAMWIASNFKTNPDFTNELIFHPAYKAIADMFNRILAEKHSLHLAVLHKDVEKLKCLLKNQSDVNDIKDDGGRTALHLAVVLGGTDLTIVKILFEKYKARTDIADSIAGWTPMQYAEQARAWNAIELFLKIEDKSIMRWPRPDSAVMLDAASNANVFVVRHLVEERGGDLDCRGTEGETMIHRAAEGGNVEMLKYLATKGLSFHTKDNELNTTLHYATHHDHVSVVSFLLEQGLDMEAANSGGLTAFQEAAQHGAYEVMAVLLELKEFHIGSSAKTSEVQLNSSLLCAAFAGSLEFIKNLVKMGALVRNKDNKGHTAAWVAMHREHYQVMDWLLLRGSVDGNTPLHGACYKGELETVAFILSRGDDIEAKGSEGRTPLLAAAWNNNLTVMELLLEKGANVEGRDENGDTPLHEASRRGHKQAVELLLRHGAKVKSANYKDWTSLHQAIRFNKREIVKLLLDDNHQPGDKLTLVGRAGVTPLVAAAIKGDLDGVKQMLVTFNAEREGMSKADLINMKDSAGWTVLHYLVRLGQSDIVSYLISQGGDQRINDNDNNTPLGLAASLRHPGTVRVLLATLTASVRAAAVNMRDKYGYTVLMWGAWGGCVECVQLLTLAGGKMSRVDNKGWTPLMLAADWNHVSVVSFLLRAFDSKSEVMPLKDYIYMKDKAGKTVLDRAEPECRKEIEKILAQI